MKTNPEFDTFIDQWLEKINNAFASKNYKAAYEYMEALAEECEVLGYTEQIAFEAQAGSHKLDVA